MIVTIELLQAVDDYPLSTEVEMWLGL